MTEHAIERMRNAIAAVMPESAVYRSHEHRELIDAFRELLATPPEPAQYPQLAPRAEKREDG